MQQNNNSELSLKGFSDAWYTQKVDGSICYTSMGESVYGPLFLRVGISIKDIETVEQHRAVVQRAVASGLLEAKNQKQSAC